MMSEMCRWPVATSSRPHPHTSNRLLLYITPASYWTVGFLHQSHCLCPWSTGGIWRRGLSLNGRQTVVGDEKIAPPPPHPNPTPLSSPIDMWRRKSWLIFVQRQCSALLCVAPIDMSSCPRPAVNSLVAQWDAPPPCPQIQFTNTNTKTIEIPIQYKDLPLSSSG